MRLYRHSIFYRLLFSIAGTGLAVAMVSGFAHYLFAARLVERSVHSEMKIALQASESYLERTYVMPVAGDLRLLAESPLVQQFLTSFGDDVLLTRPATERLFLSVSSANPDVYASIRLIDVDGREQVMVRGGRRIREYQTVGDGPPPDRLHAHLGLLFERLRHAAPGTVLFDGPVEPRGEGFSFLAGIAAREPDIGGFGGVIVARIDLQSYLAYLSDLRIFGHAMAWLLDERGRAILSPPPGEATLDPRSYLEGRDDLPPSAVVVASAERSTSDLLGLFRVALSMSPALFATQLEGTGEISSTVLLAVMLFSVLIAVLVARQLAAPLGALSTMADAVSRGDFNARVPERWGGELGLLARAFNRMVRALRETTVSRTYVDRILRSMNDTLVVLGPDRRIRTVNPALLSLLGYEESEVLGRPLAAILRDPDALERITETAVTALETTFVASDGREIPLSLSGSVMLGAGGEPEGYVCVAQDITERKRAEEALRRYERMVGASGDIMTFIDRDHVYRAVNDAYLEAFGRSREEVLGRRLPEIIDRAVYETRIKEQLDRCLAGERRTFQHWMDLPKWGHRYLDVHYDPYRDTDGTITGVVADVRDITGYKQAEEALHASERRFRVLYDDTPSMFFTVDTDGLILSANHFGAEQLGYDVDELVHMPAWLLYVPEEKESFHAHLAACLEQAAEVHRWETCKVRKDGSSLWVRETARMVPDVDGRRAVLIVSEDITEAHELSEQLSWQATHDGLTGLVNRREFESRLQRAFDTARTDPAEHVICYLDLDQFKVINDTCGHVAGDELLRQLAEVLRGHVRKHDTLARLGGDEFGLLMEHCAMEQGLGVAENLRKAIEEFRFVWEDKTFSVGASVGLVPLTAASDNIAGAMSAADAACYAAKESGRNRVHVYHPDDVTLARQYGEMQWVGRIQQALERDRFELVFQPIAPVSGPAWEGAHYELLVRMRNEDGELVPPGAFLPAAERYNLAERVDRWVVEKALEWLARHPEHVADLHLCSINLSAQSVAAEGFLDFLVARLQAHGVPPEKICFELTETAAIANLSSAARFMKSLRELGCRFALDDFGSGLSSFAYLKHLPIDFLKIDGMFIRHMSEDPIDRALVKSINDVGRVMGKRTIAEFVENEEALQVLRDIGVDYAQGFHIGVPESLDALVTGPCAGHGGVGGALQRLEEGTG